MKKVTVIMQKTADFFEQIINVLLVAAITTLFLTVVFSVLTRNINVPVVWLGELGTFSCIWAIYLGMALAYRKDQFPNVDLLHSILPEKVRQYLPIIYNVLIQVFLLGVLWSSRVFLAHLLKSGQTSAELRLPMFYAYLGPVIGYIFTSFFCFTDLLVKIRGISASTRTMGGTV